MLVSNIYPTLDLGVFSLEPLSRPLAFHPLPIFPIFFLVHTQNMRENVEREGHIIQQAISRLRLKHHTPEPQICLGSLNISEAVYKILLEKRSYR